MPLMPAVLALAGLLLAAAALGLWWRARSELRRFRSASEEQFKAHRMRAEQAEQRLLELGDHLLAVERRLNRALEQRLLERAAVDPTDMIDSEQARQLRAASTNSSLTAEADAEARLRALLAKRRE